MKYLSGLLLLICVFALPVSLMADQWQEIVSTTQPPARYGHSLVEIEGQVYLFGGYTQARGPVNDFWKFDGSTWLKIADNAPAAARYLHTAVVYNNKMYVFGGQTNATTYLSDMWSYSSDTNTWQEEPQGGLTKPAGRAHHSATITEDGSMIVYGGRGSYGDNDGYAWRYNFTTGDWTRKSSNPTGSISCHSATIINGKMYVFGGKTSSTQSNDIVSYDPVQDTWSPVIAQGDIPAPRVFYAMTTEGTSFWVFGGENTDVVAFNDTWEFNTTTKTWTRRSDMISSATRSRVAAVTSHGREIFHIMFGGMDANGTAISRSYRYVSSDTPPAGKMVLNQIGVLGKGRFSYLCLEFPQKQASVKVELEWSQANAKLSLCSFPGHANLDWEAFFDNDFWKRNESRHTPHGNVQEENPLAGMVAMEETTATTAERTLIEKTLTNTRWVVLLVRHHRKSAIASDIQLRIKEFTDNPKSAFYMLPIGMMDHNPHLSFIRFPVTPVRWHSYFPPTTQGDESTQVGADYWEWRFLDKTPRPLWFGHIRFLLP